MLLIYLTGKIRNSAKCGYQFYKKCLRNPSYFLRYLRNFSLAHSHPHTINWPLDYSALLGFMRNANHFFYDIFFRNRQTSRSPKIQPSGRRALPPGCVFGAQLGQWQGRERTLIKIKIEAYNSRLNAPK